jgi:hypothetical protein
MSSLGLGSSKKGSRVADSSMMTRNIRQTANSSSVKNEISTLGNLGIPSFRVPAVQTIQTIYKGLTPADMNALNSASLVAKYIRNYAPEPLYASSYAIPDFTIPNVTYVSGDGQTTPYVVTYNGETYIANGGSVGAGSEFQNVFLRAVVAIPGAPKYVSGADYDSGTGIATNSLSTVVSGVTVQGAWLEITAPSAFILTSYNLLWLNDVTASVPDDWVIAGSTDGGTTFTLVDTQTGQVATFTANGLYNISSWSLPFNTAAYTTYRIVISKVSAGTDVVGIGSWNLFKNIQIN